ncbi:MAG: hypothetical protein NTY09_09390 [bacterium]|nr:hypothetical protein [bacterium]
MYAPVEKHKLIFLNPGLTGLTAAWLTYHLGIDIACVFESGTKRVIREGYPESFPSDGTYFPGSFETLCDEAGLKSPDWKRVSVLKLHGPHGMEIVLDSNDGPGGFQLVMTDIFKSEKNSWLPWIQDQVEKAVNLQKVSNSRGIVDFQQVETSLADSILGLNLHEPEPMIQFFDTLASLICGRTSVQLDSGDLPIVIAGLLKGWHHPQAGGRNLAGILKNLLVDSGVRWVEADSILEVKSSADRRSILKISDGSELSAGILVVPENDRFRHPANTGEPDSIEWENWYGRAATHLETSSAAGVIIISELRPPLNDNFITWHISPEKGGVFTLASPVEGRFFPGQEHDRFQKLTANILDHSTKSLGWVFPDLAISPRKPLENRIILSGTAQSVMYSEGSMWGDDIYTRFLAAEILTGNITDLIK